MAEVTERLYDAANRPINRAVPLAINDKQNRKLLAIEHHAPPPVAGAETSWPPGA